MKARKGIRLAWGTMLAGLVATTVPAGGQTTIFVDASAQGAGDGSSWADAFTAVQPALDAAQSGDLVWVAGGTYVENITLALGVALYGGFAGTEDPATFNLADRDLVTHASILDGNQDGSVVTAPTGASETTRIDGFVIRNGTGTLSGDRRYGGGIYCADSSPTIANNRITGNGASPTGLGGGIHCSESSPVIIHNRIAGNVAMVGSGLHLHYSSPTIAGNTIADNLAGSAGGGIMMMGSSGTIMNNTISGNLGGSGFDATVNGGGVALMYSFPLIANNLIMGNGGGLGGGLGLYESSPTITNNTITANQGTAGGLYLKERCAPVVANNIIAFNSSGVQRAFFSSGKPTFRNNCVYGNAAFNFEIIADPTGTDGNISVDPRLADSAYGNMHIQADSPCVDAGDNAYMNGDSDIDGQPRIQPAGGMIDIGADESDDTVWPAGPYAIVRVSGDGDDEHDGSSWPLAKRTVQSALDAAAAVGGEVWVQAGTYCERITLPCFAHAYGGFAGTEAQRDERDWIANVTTLDGEQLGSVVTARAGYRVSTIDGFTITGGSAYRGGGVCVLAASPAIVNNAIRGNTATAIGGGLVLQATAALVANNTITGNEAGYGGGMEVRFGAPLITGNTIAGNRGSSGGGGVGVAYGGTIANNIIAFNSSGIHRSGGSPTLRHNCVYGNDSFNYDGLADLTGADGNISATPRFVRVPDPGPDGIWGNWDDNLGDVRLRAGSPCIDAGDNAYVFGALDLDGYPRIMDGDGDSIAIVDMGAYEVQEYTVPGDLDGDGDVDAGDRAVFLSTYGRCEGNAAFLPAADYDGDGCVTLPDYQAWLADYRAFNAPPVIPPSGGANGGSVGSGRRAQPAGVKADVAPSGRITPVDPTPPSRP